MLRRRDFLKTAGLLALAPTGCVRPLADSRGGLVNDVHSQLNPTVVDQIQNTDSLEAIQRAIAKARRANKPICVAGGRHAMGAQQFAAGAVLLDTRKMNQVRRLDVERAAIEVEAGIQWPELFAHLHTVQAGQARQWGIAQKQTGADRLSVGGALAANVHGRGLRMRPFIADVESFTLVDARGDVHLCSRSENAELFRLVIGGYGLFGIVYSVTLRAVPRQKVQRAVEILSIEELMSAFEKRIADGFLYGDFQYSIDENSDNFLRKGVFSCYRPIDSAIPIPPDEKQLSYENWKELLYLAHADKARVYQRYTDYYLSTNGQVYWSDTHQLSIYPENYHREIDRKMLVRAQASEIITEIYVPREALVDFMNEVRDDLRKNNVNVIYGTIRLIERDDESFLAWAKQNYACIIFNVHTVHTPAGIEHSAAAFRRLIDKAIARSGSYYLTYHKYATPEQLLTCYPQFREFLRLKKRYDPDDRFQSDWYRHYKTLLAE